MYPRPPLPSHSYDVIIIGGGVNGVAIARECALGGKRTLLLEQHDFASGTSSRATRIIHGGLRYLEHGELGLVRESLRERELLLRTKPDLVHPLRFVLAIPRHKNPFSLRSPLALRTGMMMYRWLSGRNPDAASAKQDSAMLERSLDSGQRWTLLDYEDAQCEFPERLIADWAVEAVTAGAIARNHIEVLSVEIANGRSTGVHTRDKFTGEESHFSATWIINATGPWADQVTAASNIATQRMIGGVRGSHILLPRFPGAPDSAVYSEATDGRPIFVIPWNGQTLVGTTEVADSADPARTAPTAQEVRYLMQSFLRIFPHSGLSVNDIFSCYAGVRPLPYVGKANTSAITRKHFLHDHADDGARGLISVIGGKLTTATSLARECAKQIGVGPSTEIPKALALHQSSDDHRVQHLHGKPLLPRVPHLRAFRRWDLSASEQPPTNHQLTALETLCAHTSYAIEDASHAVRKELAVTLGDILLRRIPVALDATWSQECSRIASQRIGRALGWPEATIQAAREDFDRERDAFLMKPSALKES